MAWGSNWLENRSFKKGNHTELGQCAKGIGNKNDAGVSDFLWGVWGVWGMCSKKAQKSPDISFMLAIHALHFLPSPANNSLPSLKGRLYGENSKARKHLSPSKKGFPSL